VKVGVNNMTRIFYMKDLNGNRLEASTSSGLAEKYGISNHKVLMSCLGMELPELDVTFEYRDYDYEI
jgi:hypothetical protein